MYNMTAQTFHTLSIELIVEILSFLSYYDLLRCSCLSRKIRTIILNTPALEYNLELGLTGNQDGRSSRTTVERLKALRRVQREWESPNPTLVDSMSVPSRDWSQSKCHKDVFLGRHPDDEKRLDMFNFSSAFTDEERLQHLTFDVYFDAYSVDFDQDLIVLARCSEGNETGRKVPPHIYLRSVKDQTPHPRAQQSILNLASYGFLSVSYILRARIQIAGEYIMLTLYKSLPVEAVLVWHWPTGKLHALMHFTRDNCCINAMCTESGHLLLAKRPSARLGWFGICVYRLQTEEDPPRLLAEFELPKLKSAQRGWLAASFFPREHTCGVLHGGPAAASTDFYPSPVLVQFQWDRRFTLYTPLITFLSPNVLATGSRPYPLIYPWKSWGPRSSRVFEEGHEVSIICGYRAIFPDYILDFSPATLRTALSRTNPTIHCEAEPNTLSSSFFMEPVVTSLAYSKISFTLPPSSDYAGLREMHMAFIDVNGPKLLRVTCADFILIPSSIEVFSLGQNDNRASNNDIDDTAPSAITNRV